MVNMTLAIPDELHKLMKKHDDVRWAEVARRAMMSKAEKLELMDEITKNSTLTPEDVREIGNKVKEGAARKLGLYDN